MVQKFTDLLHTATNTTQKYLTPIAQTVILSLFRFHWGYALYMTGRGKLTHHERVMNFFQGLGIPFASLTAWCIGGLECIGGLLILIGLYSRAAAFLLSGNMLVAYLVVAADRAALLGLWQDPDAFIKADPFFFLLTTAMIFAFGPGAISIDYICTRWGSRWLRTRDTL